MSLGLVQKTLRRETPTSNIGKNWRVGNYGRSCRLPERARIPEVSLRCADLGRNGRHICRIKLQSCRLRGLLSQQPFEL